MRPYRFLLSLALALTLTNDLPASEGPDDLSHRLEQLSASLEAARQEAHIPGMSIAIVKDDRVVWARGFGHADLAAERRADEHTIYAVGSATKAFTATLIGMLVDDHKLSWDDPVTDHLPYFDLQVQSEEEQAECTLRDLLSHRHGFSRMGILILSGQATREVVLRTAARAEPWDEFRKGFHYCNVTYLAAGQSAGVAAGSTWEELITERILRPLTMTSTTLNLTEVENDPRLAVGYSWNEASESSEPMKMIDLSVIGPAGSMNSNVIDMAKWLRLQLGRGELDERQLLSEASILETWEPQIEMGDGDSYGLGWMLREHKGRRIVEHGGNIDGFTAEVAFMPDEQLGYVLLMNQNASPLRHPSLALVFDALLDELPEPEDNATPLAQTEELELEDYTGIYIGNFGPFKDAKFRVLINEGQLALDIPGQQTSDLKLPDVEGQWISVLSDRIAVSFQRDAREAVVGLTIHQDSYKFELPREGIEAQPEVDTAELEKYVGTYVRAEGGRRVELTIKRGRLVMEDEGKQLDFQTPDSNGHAALRIRADWGATFETDEDGFIATFVFHGAAGDKLFTRLAVSVDANLPTIDELFALRNLDQRVAALATGGGTKLSGEVRVPQAGIRGTLTVYSEGNGRIAHHMDFGKFGRISSVTKDNRAWSFDSLRGVRELMGDELLQAQLSHPEATEGDWREFFDSVKVIGTDTVKDRPVHVVRLKKTGLPSCTYRIDAENGDVLRIDQVLIQLSTEVPLTVTFSNFEEIDGIRHAMHVELENPASGRMIMTIYKRESGLQFADDVFSMATSDRNE